MQRDRSYHFYNPAYQVLLLLLLLHPGWLLTQSVAERPNILWLVSEDNSKHYLRLYEKGGAVMPNIERLAAEGLVFEHAFSNAPVCSVARSTIISGCYAPRLGVQYHRRMELAPLPEGLLMFPAYLRQAGYYTTNNSKEDYNFKKPFGVWDESSRKATYRNRRGGQPFFHVQNFGRSHEGQLHFSAEQMANDPTTVDPDSVPVFPYHPDTPVFRYTNAKYRDLNAEVDQQIGAFLEQLESDGVLENTIVFYYGDHGGVLPRGKGYLYESGIHVPLVVRFPRKWQHLAPAKPGSRIGGFVQFIDLAPTVLHLAGLDPPAEMDGRPFLGKGISKSRLNARDQAFSYADRFDEKYDLVRAVRVGRYKYVRNFQPFNFDGLYNFYRYKMLAYREWQELFEAGSLNDVQRQFFQARAAEALYDIEADPHEVNNLAENPVYKKILKKLQRTLERQLKGMPDLSFFPEPYYLEEGLDAPARFGQLEKDRIGRLIDVANLAILPFDKARRKIEASLNSSDPWERYWGFIVCSHFGEASSGIRHQGKAGIDYGRGAVGQNARCRVSGPDR